MPRKPRKPRNVVAASTRAREAQRRFAEMREEDPMSVPKRAAFVMCALHVLLAGYDKETDDIAVMQLVDMSGESEREVQKALAWLRDALLIERPFTKGGRGVGGKGHSAPTRFLTDAEVGVILRERQRAHAERTRRLDAQVAAEMATLDADLEALQS